MNIKNCTKIPDNGSSITIDKNGLLYVPDNPIIPYIEGDGTGSNTWQATQQIIDTAVKNAYAGNKSICWMEVFAGQKAYDICGEWLPSQTIDILRTFHVGLKGSLATPLTGNERNLNATIRQKLDLYACIRPIRQLKGIHQPIKNKEKLDLILFHSISEGIYSGLEWPAGSEEASRIIELLNDELGCHIRSDSGIGINPISVTSSKQLIRHTLQYAIKQNLPIVTMIHKGNTMEFTEGAFSDWGYQLVKEEFYDHVITEKELQELGKRDLPNGKVILNDRIANATLQRSILIHPSEYSVLVCPSLSASYLSDALVAQLGGLDIESSAYVGNTVALFETLHKNPSKQDAINPSSSILAGVMMLEHIGWRKPAQLIIDSLHKTFMQNKTTISKKNLMPSNTINAKMLGILTEYHTEHSQQEST